MSVEERSVSTMLRDRLHLIQCAALLGVFFLSVLVAKLYSDVSTLKREGAVRDAKMDRLEGWFVQSMELASQRHADEMKVLTSIATGQEKSVALLDFMASYYKRAQLEGIRRK